MLYICPDSGVETQESDDPEEVRAAELLYATVILHTEG